MTRKKKNGVESLNIESSEISQNSLNFSKTGTKELSRTSILRLFRIPKVPRKSAEPNVSKMDRQISNEGKTTKTFEKIEKPVVTSIENNLLSDRKPLLESINEKKCFLQL